MEKQLADLNGKVKMLNFRISKTNEIKAEQQKTSLENMTEAVNSLKETIEERKFGKGETEGDIKEWAAEIEAVLS